MTTPTSIQKMLDWQKANAGKLRYSETASTRLAHTTTADMLSATDCSGLFARLMAHFAGINVGTYTGNICDHGTLVTTSKSEARAGHGMLPGDGILFDWDGGNWDHIAMYAGGGKIWNHGGPGTGPDLWNLASNVDAATKVMVRRYVQPVQPPAPKPPVIKPIIPPHTLEPDMFLQFDDAATPLLKESVFHVLGGSLLHVDPASFKSFGSPKPYQVSVKSEYWKLPIAAGTTDPRI